MVCNHCGKELKLLGELTKEEITNLHYIVSKNRTANTALDGNVVNFKEMTPEQVYAYFKYAFYVKAEANFLEVENLKSIAQRFDIDDIYSIMIEGEKAYLHPKE